MMSVFRGEGGISKNLTFDDMGGGGVKKGPKTPDVIYGQPLKYKKTTEYLNYMKTTLQ